MTEYDGYDECYEPTIADEIFNDAARRLVNALREEAIAQVERLKSENERLVKQNQELYKRLTDAASREREIERRESEIESFAKRARLDAILGDFEAVMYRAGMSFELGPKCDKCDDKMHIAYKTPLGNDAYEDCTCNKSKSVYLPDAMKIHSLRKHKGKPSVIWFRNINEDNAWDSRVAETVYEGQPYSNLKPYDTYFHNEEDCQAYCDWLNDKRTKSTT